MNVKMAIAVLGCTGVIADHTHGELLATYDSEWGGGTAHVFDSITHFTFLSEEFNAQEGLGTLFEDIVIYGSATQIDTVTAIDDPEFAVYAALLTDGEDWWLYDRFEFDGGAAGAFHLESVRLDFTDPNHEGSDLAGYEIESVTRTITVMLDSPGSDPNGDGIWTDFDVNTLFEIHGTIPEPSSLVVLAIGAGGLLLRHRAKGVMPR